MAINPKLDLFDALGARIKAEVPKIKTFRLFNNQFAKEGVEKAFAFPALMVEFVDLNYTAKSESLQEADTNIILHLGFASLKTEDRAVFELVQEVHQAVQAFYGLDLFSPLNRTRDQQDTDHDGVIVWQTTYTTLLSDNSANRKRRLVLAETPELIVNKDPSAPWLKPS
jgi:hypothetical protein